jgi:hypothetical protein
MTQNHKTENRTNHGDRKTHLNCKHLTFWDPKSSIFNLHSMHHPRQTVNRLPSQDQFVSSLRVYVFRLALSSCLAHIFRARVQT